MGALLLYPLKDVPIDEAEGGSEWSDTSPDAYPMSMVDPGESMPLEVARGGVVERTEDGAGLSVAAVEEDLAPNTKAGGATVLLESAPLFALPPKEKTAPAPALPVEAEGAAVLPLPPNLKLEVAAAPAVAVEAPPPNLKEDDPAVDSDPDDDEAGGAPKANTGLLAGSVVDALTVVEAPGALPKPPKDAVEEETVGAGVTLGGAVVVTGTVVVLLAELCSVDSFSFDPKEANPPKEEAALTVTDGVSVSFLVSVGFAVLPKAKLGVALGVVLVVVEATGVNDTGGMGVELLADLLAEERNPN